MTTLMKKIYVHSPSCPDGLFHVPSIYFLLKAEYADHGTQDLNWITPLVPELSVEETMDYLIARGPMDYYVMSVYSWNVTHHFEVSTLVRQLWPDCTIIAGGYQVTEQWVTDYPHVDYCITGDPENIFSAVVDGRINKPFVTNYLTKWQTSSIVPHQQEIHDLVSNLPSNIRDNLAYVWETNRGCPYSCTFCSWGDSNRRKIITKDMDLIKKELDVLLDSGIKILRIADANFGMIKHDGEIADYIISKNTKVKVLDVSWAKNHKQVIMPIARRLFDAGLLLRFKYGIQDVHDTVGVAIKRAEKVPWRTAFGEYKKSELYGEVPLRLDLIIGLPGQTKEMFFNQMQAFMDLDLDIPTVNLCQLLPNTEMTQPEYIEAWGIKSRSEKAVSHPAYVDGSHKTLARTNAEFMVDIISSTDAATYEDIGEMIVFSGLCGYMAKSRLCTGADYIKMYHDMFCNPEYSTAYQVRSQALEYINNPDRPNNTSRLNIPLQVDEQVQVLPADYFSVALMINKSFLNELSTYLDREITAHTYDDGNYFDYPDFICKVWQS